MAMTTDPTALHKCLDEIKRGISDGSITGLFVVTIDGNGSFIHRLSATNIGFGDKLGNAVGAAMVEMLHLNAPIGTKQ